MQDKSSQYTETLITLHTDWIKAGKFNIDLAREIKHDWDKTPMVRTALVTEIMRDGKSFIDAFEDQDREKITNSCLYRYSNTQQMKMHKETLKDKHFKR